MQCKEFNRAIEETQTAEQLSLKARRDLDRIKIEAEQQSAKARAEAESLRLQKQEVTPELIRLREIEAQVKAVEKWEAGCRASWEAARSRSSTSAAANETSQPETAKRRCRLHRSLHQSQGRQRQHLGRLHQVFDIQKLIRCMRDLQKAWAVCDDGNTSLMDPVMPIIKPW